MLLGKNVSLLKKAPETKSAFISWCSTCTLVHWHGTYIGVVYFWYGAISHPALLLRLLPCNIVVIFAVTLLPSHYGKVNPSFGVFSLFEKIAIMFKLIY